MRSFTYSRRIMVAAALVLAAASAFAQAPATKPYEPQVGQAGKDVVWVPTPQALVDKMLDMAAVTPRDYLVDLGSGDGRTVITAAKRGVTALGIEYEPEMVSLSIRNASAAGVADRAKFVKADLFETDFSKATVITMFLLPSINLKLRPTLLAMKPGTRVVSNTFTMEDWQADEVATIAPCDRWCTAHFWIVPARVDGTWKSAQETITLSQQFQMLTGAVGPSAIAGGRLRGEDITFTAGGAQYKGRVNGNQIEGTVVSAGRTMKWQATRVGS